MQFCLTRIGTVALLVALVGLTSPAKAQFVVNPALLANQPALTTYGVAGPGIVGAPGFSPVFSPFASPWNYYGMTPAYGALTGYANVISASAQSYVTMQQARILNEDALRSQLNTRKAVIEQMRWEYETTPSLEAQREHAREMSVRRMLNDPPLSEITSGDALNILLEQARRNQLAQVPGPLVPLDPEVLKHINVTNGTTTGGSQVARDLDALKWPLPLQAPRWKPLRDTINSAMSQATTEARSSGIQFDTDKKLNDAVKQLDQDLDAAVAELTPSEFIQSRRFLTQLKEARKTLGDPSASKYLTGMFSARGNSVAELVQNMNGSGLRFAPGLPGDESYYRVVHAAMVAYVGSQAMLSAQGPRRPPNPYQQPQ
jgi:hypothetical protein